MVAPQESVSTHTSGPSITAQELAQMAWESSGYDEEGSVSMVTFLDMCNDAGIVLDTLDPDPYCVACRSSNCGNNCDREYERAAGK